MKIFKSANILIPKGDVDFSKWSVVACDQYTSEPEYWSDVKEITKDFPTTLNITFPEVYLEDSNGDEIIKNINDTMNKYLNDGLFEEFNDSYVYVERIQSDGKLRRGIVGVVDLEAYDYNVGSTSPIRATEGTILERIPPRQKVRRDAPLELPHILMLIDDKEDVIINPLTENKESFRKLYDFELMKNSGHIKGYLVSDEAKDELNKTLDLLESKKYAENEKPLVFSVGDGNHSLATAKKCWMELKETLTDSEIETHPARFALVELVNLYEEALVFEAIHRVLFDVEPEKVLEALRKYYNISDIDNGGQKVIYTYDGNEGKIYIKNGKSNLSVGSVQTFIDDYINTHGGRVDYIHGENVVKKLSCGNAIGFMVDAMDKNDLYPTVIKDGSLPRKTFSMGDAADKRFYLEAKRIK